MPDYVVKIKVRGKSVSDVKKQFQAALGATVSKQLSVTLSSELPNYLGACQANDHFGCIHWTDKDLRNKLMSDQNLSDELAHAAKLDSKHRGELAELAFMRKAANLGFAVAKPWGDSDRYDVVVRFDKTFWRVQIKSVLALTPARPHFVIQTKDSSGTPYSRDDIDFLVAYIFAEDLWYVFPADVFRREEIAVRKTRLEKIPLGAIPRKLGLDALC